MTTTISAILRTDKPSEKTWHVVIDDQEYTLTLRKEPKAWSWSVFGPEANQPTPVLTGLADGLIRELNQ